MNSSPATNLLKPDKRHPLRGTTFLPRKTIDGIPEERRHYLISLLNPRLISKAWEVAGTRYDDAKLAKKSSSSLLSAGDRAEQSDGLNGFVGLRMLLKRRTISSCIISSFTLINLSEIQQNSCDGERKLLFIFQSGISKHCLLIIGACTLLLIRILYVIYRSSKQLHSRPPEPLSTLIIFRFRWSHCGDVKASSRYADGKAEAESVNFMQIYRSREVGQSYITSVGTTLAALAHALWLMIKIRPQVILCNGPGTCIPLCAISFVFKVVGIRWSSIFYVESIARVKRLSLSGLLLYKLRMTDQIFMQWPHLKSKYHQLIMLVVLCNVAPLRLAIFYDTRRLMRRGSRYVADYWRML